MVFLPLLFVARKWEIFRDERYMRPIRFTFDKEQLMGSVTKPKQTPQIHIPQPFVHFNDDKSSFINSAHEAYEAGNGKVTSMEYHECTAKRQQQQQWLTSTTELEYSRKL